MASNRIAVKHSSLASTGIMKLDPGSINTVPGKVVFSLDLRASEDKVLLDMEEEMKHEFSSICKSKCEVSWTTDFESEVVKFSSECIRCVEDSTRALFGIDQQSMVAKIYSGAGSYLHCADW